MKKAVDLVERTLEKDKKEFVEICGIWHVLCKILMVVLAIAGVVVVLDFVAELSVTNLFSFISDIVSLAMDIIVINFGIAIFKKLKTGETPFRYDIADKIKGAGYVLIFGNIGLFIVGTVASIISGYLEPTGVEIAVNGVMGISFNVGRIFEGLVLVMIAYVFNYGCKLQHESDETV